MICCAKLAHTLCAACELRDLVRIYTQDLHNLCETLCYQHDIHAPRQPIESEEKVYD